MTDIISVTPAEKGTAIVTIAPTDEDGNALAVGQLTDPAWQLMKKDGTIINERAFADSPLTALSWVIKGDDLAVFGPGDSGVRIIFFQATYDSTLGNDLPLNAECKFSIDKLVGQVDSV